MKEGFLSHKNQRNNQLQASRSTSLPCSKINLFLFSTERIRRIKQYVGNHTSTTMLDRDHLSHPNPACIPPTRISTSNHSRPITIAIIQLYPTSASTLASLNCNCT